ncbi:MAG: hypothetical protein IJE97_05185 [Thermoguttaceae bacterium]|nr:hypothetical protein [Thermoguttaceae bacterium]
MFRKSLLSLAVAAVAVFSFASNAETFAADEPTEGARVVFKYLEDRDYSPKYDSDNDIVFEHNNDVYLIVFDEDDEEFFRILRFDFYTYKNENELYRSFVAANKVNKTTKAAKVIVPEKYVEDPERIFDGPVVAIEAFSKDANEFARSIPRSLSAITTAVKEFRSAMRNDD